MARHRTTEDDLYEFKEKFSSRMKAAKRRTRPGNISGLSKHLANKHGGDPNFFTKCMADDELQDYDHDARAAICARAHKIAIGHWPGEDKKSKEFSESFKEAFSKKKIKKADRTLKGGEGSGFFGHAGIPGHHGGSAPSNGSQPGVSPESSGFIKTYQDEILSSAGERPSYDGDVGGAISTRLKQVSHLVPGDSATRIQETASNLDKLLESSGVSPQIRHALAMESVDALAAQDHESLTRTLGDHGINHIGGNIDFSTRILGVIPGEDSPSEMAKASLACIFHDTGYMTPQARSFDDKAHPQWSQEHYDANIRPLVEKALGKSAANQISGIISTHAGTDINYQDPVGTSVRMADNLGLFKSQKLPGVFRYAPDNLVVLENYALGRIDIESAKKEMSRNVRRTSLSPKVKQALQKAVSELNPRTPKFTLGMMGGEVEDFSWNKDHVSVSLRQSREATRLNKILDLGQRQFAKYAETYGVQWEQLRNSLSFSLKQGNRVLLESFALSAKEYNEILLKALKGGQGSGFFGHAGRPGKQGGSAASSSIGAVVNASFLADDFRLYGTTLSSEDRKYMYDYSHFGAFGLNSALRRGEAGWDETTKAIDRIIDSAPPLESELTVYRMYMQPTLEEYGIEEWRTFKDRAYVSTTIDPQLWGGRYSARSSGELKHGFVKITLPKGTRCFWMDGLSHVPNEQEILLPRNSKFTVTKVEEPNYAEMEYLGHD